MSPTGPVYGGGSASADCGSGNGGPETCGSGNGGPPFSIPLSSSPPVAVPGGSVLTADSSAVAGSLERREKELL